VGPAFAGSIENVESTSLQYQIIAEHSSDGNEKSMQTKQEINA